MKILNPLLHKTTRKSFFVVLKQRVDGIPPTLCYLFLATSIEIRVTYVIGVGVLDCPFFISRNLCQNSDCRHRSFCCLVGRL